MLNSDYYVILGKESTASQNECDERPITVLTPTIYDNSNGFIKRNIILCKKTPCSQEIVN